MPMICFQFDLARLSKNYMITNDNKQQGQQFHCNSHFEKKFWPKDREAEGPARIEREAQESRCHVIFVPCFFWIATF